MGPEWMVELHSLFEVIATCDLRPTRLRLNNSRLLLRSLVLAVGSFPLEELSLEQAVLYDDDLLEIDLDNFFGDLRLPDTVRALNVAGSSVTSR